MSDPNIGRLLDNRYQLVELIGKGAMGRVYRAKHALLGGDVAVKFLAQTLLNKKMQDRFYKEAQTCAQLGQKSIHVVRVTDYGVDTDEIPFYVMEYLTGQSLSEVITNRPLPIPRFLNLSRQICLGLQCAHEGIVIDNQLVPIIHRDIKPSNIWISQDPSFGELAKILDFGIAKLMQSGADQTNCFMGTLAYSSPEQMEGRELDNRSDIYSLGVMMYQMLTAEMPLYAETHTFGSWYKVHHFQPPRAFAPDFKVPKAVENLVMACLAKSPGDRPQTAKDILDALEPLEQRFGSGRQIGQRIGAALSKLPVAPDSIPAKIKQPPITTTNRPISISTSTATDPGVICRNQVWPSGTPIAEIVFPQLIETPHLTLPTLWVMLTYEEIKVIQDNRLYNKLYKNFLCTLSPYPMALWLTAVYNSKHHQDRGPRWLRCYLDLKKTKTRQITRLLGEQGSYCILFFAKESPTRCMHVTEVTIHPLQCNLLKEWVVTSEGWAAVGDANMSKELLKAEFEKLKLKVNQDLENTVVGPSFEGMA